MHLQALPGHKTIWYDPYSTQHACLFKTFNYLPWHFWHFDPYNGGHCFVHAARSLPYTPQLVSSKEINNGQKPKTDAPIKVMIPCPVDSISDLELCYRRRGQTLEAKILQPQSKYSVMNLSDHPQRDQWPFTQVTVHQRKGKTQTFHKLLSIRCKRLSIIWSLC